jgi:DNA-binding response OmpR family regulator
LKRAADSKADAPLSGFSVYQIGSYYFDSQQFTLTFQGEQQLLTEMESDLLKLLCDSKNQLVQREMVLQKMWGRNDFLARKSMDVFISRLRKYLSKDPHVQIVNVHSSGFVLQISEPGPVQQA